ncbi:hypothetical protein BgiMline_002397, partial [Biomphalaria glabrata]
VGGLWRNGNDDGSFTLKVGGLWRNGNDDGSFTLKVGGLWRHGNITRHRSCLCSHEFCEGWVR